MLDEERGTYSPPTEDTLSYEARRRPRRDQAPLTLIISGIFLVVLLIAVVIFLNSSLRGHGRIPTVGDTLGDVKDTTQVQDAQPLTEQQLSNPDDSAQAKFAPDTETPGVRDTPQATVDQAPPTAAAINGPLPSQVGNPALSASASASTSSVAAVTASSAASAAAGGGSIVQIGAFTSPDIATTEYNKLASSYGLFLGGTSKRVEKVETPTGTYYRTSFVGFATPDKAHAFCAALKAANHDCFVK